ncbi:MAG TPA: efflux RND transporter periplasmic adaptor subunit [bacterium]|nr:efflux RND transporter periplasmic adaptor subunit [bacterium]
MKEVTRKTKILVGLMIAVIAVAVFVYRVITGDSEAAPPSIKQLHEEYGIPVDVAAVELRDVTRTISLSGVLEGVGEVNVSSNIPMRVQNLHVQQGARVYKNQLLVTLDPLSSASTYASYEAARIAYEDAQRNVKRLEPLHQAGAISDADWDMAKSGLARAQAGLTNLRASVQLRSPIAGTVTRIVMKRGDMADPGKAIVTVATTNQLKLVAQVSQKQATAVSLGDQATIAVTTPAGEAQTVVGKVGKIGLSADPGSRLFQVEIAFDNQDGLLLSGTLQKAEVAVATAAQALAVPAKAIVTSNNRTYVFRVTDDQANFVPVTVGISNADYAQVSEGLQADDSIVVNGVVALDRTKPTKIRLHQEPAAGTE